MEITAKGRVRKLASSGEGEHIEYKRKVEDPRKIVKELIAFANAHGGTLLIGVSDDGTLSGLAHPEGDWFILEQAIDQFCKPVLNYDHSVVEISSKASVIVVDIPESSTKPHYFQEIKNAVKEVYLRQSDECIRVSREMAELMHFQRRRVFIKYGEEEELLLEYLRGNKHITVDGFKELATIPRRKASRILVKLTAAKVLKLLPGNRKVDQFELTE